MITNSLFPPHGFCPTDTGSQYVSKQQHTYFRCEYQWNSEFQPHTAQGLLRITRSNNVAGLSISARVLEARIEFGQTETRIRVEIVSNMLFSRETTALTCCIPFKVSNRINELYPISQNSSLLFFGIRRFCSNFQKMFM